MPQLDPGATASAHVIPADLARDRYADLLRTVALGLVIFGHWTMGAVSVTADGSLAVNNVLNIDRWLWPVTWVLVLIPLFFFVGGFSNATSLHRARARGTSDLQWRSTRLAGLIAPVAPFFIVIAAVVAVALWLGAPRDLTLTVAVVVLMPLWFVAVYAVLIALTPTALRLDARWGAKVWLVMAVAAVAVDIARIATDIPYVGYLNYILVWGLAQQLGFAYRDGRLLAMRTRTTTLWALAAVIAMALVAASPWWGESMIGLSGQRSTMNPPSTLAMLHVLAQVPVAVALRRWIAPKLAGPRIAPLLDLAASQSMRAFLWHLPILVGALGLWHAFSLPLPEPGSAMWWATRPPHLVALSLLLVGFLSIRRSTKQSPTQPRPTAPRREPRPRPER